MLTSRLFLCRKPRWIAFLLLLSSSRLFAAAGDLYVADLSSTITKITPAGAQSPFATGFDPYGIAFNAAGEAFVASSNLRSIFKIAPDGTKTTFASNLSDPLGLVCDQAGNVYAADFGVSSVLKFTPNGTKSVFAATVFHADGIALDPSGNLFVTGFSDGKVTKISPTGTKSTFAMSLVGPVGVACDAAGNVFVAERDGGRIVRFTPGGTKSIFSSEVGSPYGLAFDAAGDLFASEQFTGKIFRFTPDGVSHPVVTLSPEVGFLAVEPATGNPVNISTRLTVLTGENVLIGGFIITGTQSKKVILRGMGPSLKNVGVTGTLENPTLELFDGSGNSMAFNNDWKESQQSSVEATGIPPGNDLEAAIVATLPPGTYTAIERGRGNTTGIGIVEIYDLDTTGDSQLANISTRGFVGSGNDVMIGGFIEGTGNGGRIVVRAIGPSLAQFGITNALTDPSISLRDANGAVLRQNDNWKADQQSAIEGTTLAPKDDLEAAITTSLPQGNYTAIVSGQNGGTGVALLEIYALH